MSRHTNGDTPRTAPPSAPPGYQPTHQAPPTIEPNSVYSLDQARQLLGLAKGCLPREIRLGRLRVAKRAGRYLITGAWLLQWIEGGELKRTTREGAP
jgi:hypothetical protein